MQEEHQKKYKEQMVQSVNMIKKCLTKNGPSRIPHKEFVLLSILFTDYERDYQGERISSLANALMISMPEMSRMLKKLENKNWIERRTETGDRRNTRVYLKEEGASIFTEEDRRVSLFMMRVAKDMGEEKFVDMLALLNEFAKYIEIESNNRKE